MWQVVARFLWPGLADVQQASLVAHTTPVKPALVATLFRHCRCCYSMPGPARCSEGGRLYGRVCCCAPCSEKRMCRCDWHARHNEAAGCALSLPLTGINVVYVQATCVLLHLGSRCYCRTVAVAAVGTPRMSAGGGDHARVTTRHGTHSHAWRPHELLPAAGYCGKMCTVDSNLPKNGCIAVVS